MLGYPAWELFLGSAGSRLVSEAGDLPLGISRLRSFRLGTSRGNFGLEAFAWQFWLGNLPLGTFALDLSLWDFLLDTPAWKLVVGSFFPN